MFTVFTQGGDSHLFEAVRAPQHAGSVVIPIDSRPFFRNEHYSTSFLSQLSFYNHAGDRFPAGCFPKGQPDFCLAWQSQSHSPAVIGNLPALDTGKSQAGKHQVTAQAGGRFPRRLASRRQRRPNCDIQGHFRGFAIKITGGPGSQKIPHSGARHLGAAQADRHRHFGKGRLMKAVWMGL